MKSILVPIDCSVATPRVLDLAQQLGRAFQAELHLVHVREMPSLPVMPLGYGALGMPEMVPMAGAPIAEAIAQTIPPNEDEQSKLAKWQQEIRQAGLKVTLYEPTGDVLDELLKRADAVNADMIVMGRHGHGAMYNLLVGSVTEGMLKHNMCPVLLVPSVDEAKS
jgi:nucleotide-binding universal stress UspA family protein